jgi:hypothetical protein
MTERIAARLLRSDERAVSNHDSPTDAIADSRFAAFTWLHRQFRILDQELYGRQQAFELVGVFGVLLSVGGDVWGFAAAERLGELLDEGGDRFVAAWSRTSKR